LAILTDDDDAFELHFQKLEDLELLRPDIKHELAQGDMDLACASEHVLDDVAPSKTIKICLGVLVHFSPVGGSDVE
jgi:hypothetical protein